MNILTKIAAPALAATLALGVAAPASAAHFDKPAEIKQDIRQLDRQIDRALMRHQITRQEAYRFNAAVDRLEYRWRVFARGGFTRTELNKLDRQVDMLKIQLQREIRDDRFGGRDKDAHDRRDDRGTSKGQPGYRR